MGARLIAVFDNILVVLAVRGNEILLCGDFKLFVEAPNEQVSPAHQVGQAGGIVRRPPQVMPAVALVPPVALVGIKVGEPGTVHGFGMHELCFRVIQVLIIVRALCEESGILFFSQGSGKLGQAPILESIFEGLGRAVTVKRSGLDAHRDIASFDIVVCAAADGRVMFVSGLAHQAARKVVLAQSFVGRVDIEAANPFLVGRNKQRCRGGRGHDKGVVAS